MKKILVVCHDAGGAEVISAYVKKNISKYSFFCLAKGPAIKIFKRKKLNKNLISEKSALKKLAEKISLVLTGTSWGSKIEISFIKKAKKQNIKTVAYLDHWTNYKERFGYPKKNWQNNLPDEIWTSDKDAHNLGKKLFKKTLCKLVPNLYWKEIKKEYQKIKKQLKTRVKNILFISEPINTNKIFPFDEFDVLEKLLKHLTDKKIKNEIIICRHPSEKKDKYDFLIKKYRAELKIRKESKNKLKEIAQAKLIIGMMSMMLVTAMLCGKKVISFIPDSQTKCPIPLSGIIKIKKIKELNKHLK